MKISTTFALVLAAVLGFAVNLHSQGVLPKSPIDRLKEIKARNADLIEKQKATLTKLDEMDKQAEQMRFLMKRS
ncbi:hypothetical protein CfE428DRAFT_2600 [Chthoniobacter flavus Ellin428]|uniref:Uncharacterized protein n=1 Tax=Chthoniobacter flavus Ellin428 TaxID=497964 RepID=B4D0Z9_9BACT|nr:hypothetical protein [Chthoniobacter flavus]EDY20011.1 hypothetical protein CfE428DRAFT_2600 [Chthoniobacter flavus Ellin428]TCO91722.1 hypothetical protein EV701_1073 [Chthoniobacter flavus]